MPQETQGSFEFGPFRLDPDQQQLFAQGKPLALTPKAFDTLVVLVRNHGRLVSKEELLKTVWPDSFVEESTLAQNVFRLRRLLGDDGDGPLYIETIPKRGYRFIAPVTRPTADAPAESIGSSGLSLVHNSAQPAVAPVATPVGSVVVLEPKISKPATHWRAYALFALGMLSIAAAGLFVFRPSENVPRVVRSLQITTFGRAADPMAIAGDRLFMGLRTGGVREVAQISILPGSPSAKEPLILPTGLPKPHVYDVSADGTQLLLGAVVGANEERPIWSMPSAGGSPHRLGNLTATGAAWSPDNSQIAYTSGSSLYVVKADGTDARALATVSGTPLWPRWSYDGRVIRFTVQEPVQQAASIWEISSSGGAAHLLFADMSSPDDRWGAGSGFGNWSRDGKYFFFVTGRYSGNNRTTSFWVVRESNRWGARATAKQIFVSPLQSGPPVLSQDGNWIFFTAHQEDRELMKLDPAQQRFVSWLNGAEIGFVTYSRDGQWVSFVSYPDGVLWRARADGSAPLRLVESPVLPFAPAFSPDGTHVAYHDASGNGGSRISVVSRDGGLPVTLTAGDDSYATWFPDGNEILYLHRMVPGKSDADSQGIYRMNLSTKKKERIPDSDTLTDPMLSPNGHYIIAPNGDFQRLKLFNFASQKWGDIASGTFVRSPRWSHDSQWVYFQDYYDGIQQPVYRVHVPDGRTEKIATSAQFQRSDVFHGYLFQALTPDDAPLVSLLRNKSDVYALELEFPK